MDTFQRAVAVMDNAFGSPANAIAVHTFLQKNAEAKVVYDCAIRALVASFECRSDPHAMAKRLDKALQDRGIFSIGMDGVYAIVNELRKP